MGILDWSFTHCFDLLQNIGVLTLIDYYYVLHVLQRNIYITVYLQKSKDLLYIQVLPKIFLLHSYLINLHISSVHFKIHSDTNCIHGYKKLFCMQNCVSLQIGLLF